MAENLCAAGEDMGTGHKCKVCGATANEGCGRWPAQITAERDRLRTELSASQGQILALRKALEQCAELIAAAYTRWGVTAEPSFQDAGRTVKVFVKHLDPPPAGEK